jgi:hypothetical protein
MACARADQAPARLLYATKVRAWNEQFAATVTLAAAMMEEAVLPPETDPDALAAWFRFENDALERKVTALESQASQTAPLIADLGPAMFRAFIARRVLPRGRPRRSRWPRVADGPAFSATCSLLRHTRSETVSSS